MQPVGLAELDSDLEILKADIEADKALPTVGNTVQTTCVVSPTIWYAPTLLTHYFSAAFRPFCAVFSPLFRGFWLPGAKTERTGERRRKMGEIWVRNGRETAVT